MRVIQTILKDLASQQISLNDELEKARENQGRAEATLGNNWLQKFVFPHLQLALLVTFSVLFVPLLIKLTLYFLVAPAASRREPLRLIPDAGGSRIVAIS